MPELKFPRFNQLPPELRDDIWARFALPRGPMLHSISPKVGMEDLMLGSLALSGRDIDQMVNVYNLPTTRALMQVNQEARKAVLAGRELQKVSDHRYPDHMYTLNVFLGGVYNINDNGKRRLMLHRFFFVNWDIDMFYFRCGLQEVMHMFLDSDFLHKIKHIAIEIDGPKSRRNVLYAPPYHNLWGTTISCPMSFIRPSLPSVSTIYLAIGYYTVQRMGAYMLHPKYNDSENEGQGQDQNEPEVDSDDELETDFGMYFTDDIEWIDEEACEEWLAQLPMDKYGFHHIEPSRKYVLKTLNYLSGRKNPTRVEGSFSDWVDELTSRAKEETREICGQPVEVEMVMDHCGDFDHMIRVYHRGHVGVMPVDEPAPAR
ncbi:hypothetical protein F4823DRAFT_636546 [Ustulina deusta]|nr:hypothetical protein F4823DRAFT_636546 [Ustulina deusta]